MANFNSIQFQPNRPFLKEVSADRLNAILTEIKRNRPKGERGITVRHCGDATYIGLATSIPRATQNETNLAWDLIVSNDEDSEDGYIVSVVPGTLNGFLPENWDDEFNIGSGLYYAKAAVQTDGRTQTNLTIAIDQTAPEVQEPAEFALPSSAELLFGIVVDGVAFRTIGSNFIATPKLWLTTAAETPPQPGELPFRQYFYFA